MYPWIFFWAPHLYFPWSGGVAQHIEPNTRWFFDSILPEAGKGDIEKKAFEVASYGRQLGLIIEILIAAVEDIKPDLGSAEPSLKRLKAIQADIQKLKETSALALLQDIHNCVTTLKNCHQTEYSRYKLDLQGLID